MPNYKFATLFIIKKIRMKKFLWGAMLAFFVVPGCGGGGHACDAYKKADYGNYSKKIEKDKKKSLVLRLEKK